MKTFIQLGKYGDIITILPILKAESDRHDGQPVNLVVCREYASILEACSYVKPVIFRGEVQDLRSAMLFAKSKFSNVVNLQMHGDINPIRLTPSFQLEQWKRAGMEDQWDKLPLEFDKRDFDEENRVLAQHATVNGYFIFADHSQSSPFLHKEYLANELLKSRAGEMGLKMVRMSEILVKKMHHALSLFGCAKFIVAVESSFLHLSKAVKTPVIALAADHWRGSAFSTRFNLFMRYSEWDRRKDEVAEEIERIVTGTDRRPVPWSSSILSHAYNPSVVADKDGTIAMWREHTRNDWRTELFVNGHKVHVDPSLQDYSIEDARLFFWRDKLLASYTVSTMINKRFCCYIAYGELTGMRLDHIRIKYPGNDFASGMTKNWTPFVIGDNIYFIYGIKDAHQIVLQVVGDAVRREFKTTAPTWPWGEIRGGCVIPWNGKLLRFFHSRQHYGDKTQRYFVGAMLMEPEPPFSVVAISRKPILAGDERWHPSARHWKPNVVFPLGCVRFGDGWKLSFGRNDCECCEIELKEKDLNL